VAAAAVDAIEMNAVLEKLRKQIKPGRATAAKPVRKGPEIRLPAGTPLPLPPIVVKSLKQVISRHKSVRISECLALLLTALPALWLVQATADWWFNLPWLVRFILLLADLGVVGYIVYRFAVRPLSRSFTLETAALRVEKEIPEFRSALISAVELASGHPGCAQGSLGLVKELIARVTAKVQSTNLAKRVVKTANLRRWAKWAAISLVVTLGLGAVFWPRSLVLIQRILLSTQPLPTRTVVIPVSRNESAVVGADVKLAARAEGVVPRGGMLRVVYANGDRQNIPVNPSPEDAEVFSVTLQNVQQSFTYQFALNDGVGSEFSVAAKTAPVLETLKIVQTYPAYTGLPATEMPVGNLTLLAGSKIRLEGRATQALREAAVQLEGVNEGVKTEAGKPDAQSFKGEFAVPKQGLTGISLALTNTEGVASQENTVYRVELVEDRPPVVEMTAPIGERLSVLLTSKPRLVFSVKDDYAVKGLALKFELIRPGVAGGESVTENGEIPLPLPKDGTPQTFVWDLSKQKPAITEGCTLNYWIEAADNNDVTGPGIGQTPKKSLAVVSQAEKRAELLEILGARAAEIEEISNTQKKVNEDLDSSIRKNQP
jgi:hypothetical protein